MNERRGETTDRIRLNGPGVCLSPCFNGRSSFARTFILFRRGMFSESNEMDNAIILLPNNCDCSSRAQAGAGMLRGLDLIRNVKP